MTPELCYFRARSGKRHTAEILLHCSAARPNDFHIEQTEAIGEGRVLVGSIGSTYVRQMSIRLCFRSTKFCCDSC